MPDREYSIMVEPLSAEDGGGFIATVPDLPGCMSDGETEVEARQNIQTAINDWIRHAAAEGRRVPPPNPHYRYGT